MANDNPKEIWKGQRERSVLRGKSEAAHLANQQRRWDRDGVGPDDFVDVEVEGLPTRMFRWAYEEYMEREVETCSRIVKRIEKIEEGL